jgi:hypothetical protein
MSLVDSVFVWLGETVFNVNQRNSGRTRMLLIRTGIGAEYVNGGMLIRTPVVVPGTGSCIVLNAHTVQAYTVLLLHLHLFENRKCTVPVRCTTVWPILVRTSCKLTKSTGPLFSPSFLTN